MMPLYLGDAPKLKDTGYRDVLGESLDAAPLAHERRPGLSSHDPIAHLDMWPTEETKQQRSDAFRWSLFWARGVDLGGNAGLVLSTRDDTNEWLKEAAASKEAVRHRRSNRWFLRLWVFTFALIVFLLFLIAAGIITGEAKRNVLTRKTYAVGAILAGLTWAYLSHRKRERKSDKGETVNDWSEWRYGG